MSYNKLIAQLINEAKEEVENAWEWNYQRASVDITTVAGTDTYAITGAGQDSIIEAVMDTISRFQLPGPINNAWVDFNRTVSTANIQTGSATYFDLVGVDASGQLKLRITPTPSAATTIRVFGRIHQNYLSTGTDDNTFVRAPWRPVIYLAYKKAVSERGEDGGQPLSEVDSDYTKALNDAIALDQRYGHVNTDWYPN